MELSYGVKVGYFFWSMGLGGILCLLYDFVRCGRRVSKPSVFWVNLEDGLFFLLAGVLFFWAAFDKNGGNLRWHGFLGTILGTLGYYFLFRNRIMNFTVLCTQSVICILLKLLHWIAIPVQILFRFLAKPVYVIAWYSKKSIAKSERIRKVHRKKKELAKKILEESKNNESFR